MTSLVKRGSLLLTGGGAKVTARVAPVKKLSDVQTGLMGLFTPDAPGRVSGWMSGQQA